MCFHISITTKKKTIEKRFNASFDSDTSFTPNQHFNAFNHPKIPVITNDKPRQNNGRGAGSKRCLRIPPLPD